MTLESTSDHHGVTAVHRRRRAIHLRAAAPIAVALLLAACGGATPTAAPTTTPTAVPTVLPTATPLDVGAAFLAIVGGDDFAAKLSLDGTIEMGITAAMSGTIEGSGNNSRQSMTITFGPTTTTTESVRVGQEAWTRTLPGPWLPKTLGSGSEKTIDNWLAGLTTLDDLGLVTKDGVSLHHLRPQGGSNVPPDALGLDPAQFTNPDISIELYAKDDGTPALFELTGSWSQTISGQLINVELSMDVTVTNVGKAITITAPTDVWTAYTSELDYTVAHPKDFTVVPDPDGDTFQSEGADWFYVVPYPQGKGLTAAGFRDAILASYATNPGPPRAAPVATSFGGSPASLVAFEFQAEDGTDLVLIDVLTVHGDLGWEISLVTTPTDEAADTKLFESFLASFKFTN